MPDDMTIPCPLPACQQPMHRALVRYVADDGTAHSLPGWACARCGFEYVEGQRR